MRRVRDLKAFLRTFVTIALVAWIVLRPNSAHAAMTQTYEMGRGDWQITVRAGADMTSTAASFDLSAWIEAYEGEKSVFRKEWSSKIPRHNI